VRTIVVRRPLSQISWLIHSVLLRSGGRS
jgi:hypothetical protein